jgi:hypothetical protein
VAAAIDFGADRLVVDEVEGLVVIGHGTSSGAGVTNVAVWHTTAAEIRVAADPRGWSGPALLAERGYLSINSGFVGQQEVRASRSGDMSVAAVRWPDDRSAVVEGNAGVDIERVADVLAEQTAQDWRSVVEVVSEPLPPPTIPTTTVPPPVTVPPIPEELRYAWPRFLPAARRDPMNVVRQYSVEAGPLTSLELQPELGMLAISWQPAPLPTRRHGSLHRRS